MPLKIPNDDRVRLLHMLDASREALAFSAGRDRRCLDTEPMYRRAVIHCIQEIGESAVRVKEETRDQLPELPWKQIVGMRHRLVHVYFAINHDLIWEVIVKDLQPLVEC